LLIGSHRLPWLASRSGHSAAEGIGDSRVWVRGDCSFGKKKGSMNYEREVQVACRIAFWQNHQPTIKNNNRRLNGLASKVSVFKQMCINWPF